MTKVIDQNGNKLTWTAVYMRHGGKYEETCEDLNNAVAFLFWGSEYGTLSPTRIVCPTGEVIEDEALDEAFDRYQQQGEMRADQRALSPGDGL